MNVGNADNVATEAVAGGVGSVLGGGKFANGAETGSFRYLFNECATGGCFGGITGGMTPGMAQAQSEEIEAESDFQNSPFMQDVRYVLDQIYLFGGWQGAVAGGNYGYEASGGAYTSLGGSGGYLSGGPASGVNIGSGTLYGVNFGSLSGVAQTVTISGFEVSVSINLHMDGSLEGLAAGPSEEAGVVYQQSDTYTAGTNGLGY